MGSIWAFVSRRLNIAEPSFAGLAPMTLAPSEPTPPQRSLAPSLDGIGQRNELLQVRFSQLGERLDDLKTLADDFAQLVHPVDEIVTELPRAKARILELEALLSQEMESGQALRREVDGLSDRLSTTQGELSTFRARCQTLEHGLRERDAAGEEMRLMLRERMVLVDSLERQLTAEKEKHDAVAAEFAAQAVEIQSSEQALTKAERALAKSGEQRMLLEQETTRLQKLVEEQLARLLELEGRAVEQSQSGDAQQQQIAALETQLAAEQAARRRNEEFYDAELAALSSERASLSLKFDAANARLSAGDQILGQVRRQLQDKDEALRAAQRTAKEALAERASFDRRLESVRADLDSQVAQLQEARRSALELEDRSEMLSKALSAKDAVIETANGRIASLQDRIESLTRRFENDRMGLEAANRRLIEELQNEKAERAMAQGALDIARESRFSLQRQNVTLKRAARGLNGAGDGDASETGVDREEPRTSNVAPFAAPERKD